MGNTPERIKKRREYIQKKIKADLKGSITWCLCGVCALLAAISGVLSVYFYGWLLHDGIDFVLMGSASLTFGLGAWIFACISFHAQQEADRLPYIPPVTADTLPAEEVLVRGSEEPPQEQGKVLLRGTDSSTGTGEQELLRSSQRQEG